MAWCDGMAEPRLLISPVQESTAGKDNSFSTNSEGCLLSLHHPKSGASTSYVMKDGFLYELHWFKQSFGSWFLGDYVCEDGTMYIMTPVDPVFILLPMFSDARLKKGNDPGMFRQLDEILYVEGYPGYQHLMSIAEDTMQLVCDVKEVGSSKFFRLDNSKVLSWLCCKAFNLKETLTKLDSNYAIQGEKETLKDVISILGEYLKDDPWLILLCSYFQLELQDAQQKAHKNEEDLVFPESTPASSFPLQGKAGNGKSMPRIGKQSKKLKTETDSHNIKDMFRRVTRKGR